MKTKTIEIKTIPMEECNLIRGGIVINGSKLLIALLKISGLLNEDQII